MMPTTSARAPLSGRVSMPSRSATPVGSDNQSQPNETFEASKFAAAREARVAKSATTPMSTTIWAAHLSTVAFRHSGCLVVFAYFDGHVPSTAAGVGALLLSRHHRRINRRIAEKRLGIAGSRFTVDGLRSN